MRAAPLPQSQWWTLVSVGERLVTSQKEAVHEFHFNRVPLCLQSFLDCQRGHLKLLNQVCMQDFYKMVYGCCLLRMCLCNISSLRVKKDIPLAALPTQPGLSLSLYTISWSEYSFFTSEFLLGPKQTIFFPEFSLKASFEFLPLIDFFLNWMPLFWMLLHSFSI